MRGQLRPGLRADDDDDGNDEDDNDVGAVMAAVLTVVLEEGVEEEEEEVAGAEEACSGFADDSTFRCIFSTFTAGLEEKVTDMKCENRESWGRFYGSEYYIFLKYLYFSSFPHQCTPWVSIFWSDFWQPSCLTSMFSSFCLF